MRKLVTILFVLVSLSAQSQIVNKFRDSSWFKGGVRFDSTLVFTKGAGNGKVWTSNANGTGSWQTFSASGVSQGALNDSISAVRSIRKVDTLYRNLDSLVFKINGVRYSVLDSTGGEVTQSALNDSIARIDSSINSIPIPNLQSVTDNSNLTTNNIVSVGGGVVASLDTLYSCVAALTTTDTIPQLYLANINGGIVTLQAKDITGIHVIEIPDTSGNLAMSVNNVFADGFGNISLNYVDSDSLAKVRQEIADTSALLRGLIPNTPTFALSKNTTRDSIVTVFNGTRSAVKDSVGGAVALNQITAASASNNINNANNKQRWQWNTIDGDTAFIIESINTNASSSLQNIFTVKTSGANATSAQTTKAGVFSNTHTGTTSTNIALELTASGAVTNNFALNVTAGNVAIPSDSYMFLKSATTNGNYIRYNSISSLTELNGGATRLFITTQHPSFIFADGTGGGSMMCLARPSANNYAIIFGGQYFGGYLGETTTSNTISSASGILKINGNTGQSGGFASFTPNEIASFKPTGVFNLKPITATAASAITPAEGDIVMVSNTNGTFTSIGLWGYQNGSWQKL